MPRAELPSGGQVAAVFAVTALAGFAMGALRPALHVAVEGAQVAAGVVHYPEVNPFGLYQKSVWTIWHQLLAPAVAIGVHERTLSVIVSGVIGALGFAGLGLVTLAAGGPAWLACGVPFLVVVANPAGWGFRYPIYLLGVGHTYGEAGLAWQLLAVGLLGTGRWRAGAFALGFGPALHVSLGAWLALAAVACAASSSRDLLPRWREILVGGALGVLCAGISLAVHVAGAPSVRIDPGDASLYLDTFVRLWDHHRVPPNLFGWRAATVLCTVAIAALASVRGDPPAARRVALRVLAFAGALGLGLGIVQHVLTERALPDLLRIAMPTRLLNVPMLALPALAAGLAWERRDNPLAQAALVLLAAGAFIAARLPWSVKIGLPVIAGLVLVSVWRASRPTTAAPRRLAGAVLALATVAAGVLGFYESVRDLRMRLAYLIDRSNDPALAAASTRAGGLAVAGIEVAQLRTRRPLLIDPNALDMLPYALAGGPSLVRILDRVYGVDFFHPPKTAIHRASLPGREVRDAWEARSPREWAALGREFEFSDVLAPAAWRLQLVQVARSPLLTLYRVPTDAPDGGEPLRRRMHPTSAQDLPQR